MTLLHMDGFDHYGDDETKLTEGVYDQADSVFSLSSSNPRTGSKCIRRDSTSVEGNIIKSFSEGFDAIGAGFAIYIDQLPASSNSYILAHIDDSSGTEQLIFFIGVNGEIYATLKDRSTMVASSSNSVITSGAYNHIEMAAIADSGVESIQIIGDIDGLEYSGKNLSASQTTSIVDAFIGNGDRYLYLLDNTPNIIFQYEMSSLGDITTAVYTGKSFSTQPQVGAKNNHSITFKNDGTKMYITESSISPLTTYQYSLSTAWDISTASYDTKSFTSGQDNFMFAIQFNNDGTIMMGVGDVNNKIFEYSLSTAWDISTAIFSGDQLDISNELTDAHNFRFNPSGLRLYVLGFTNNTIFQYNLSSPFDITTAAYSGNSFSGSESTETHGFCFNSDITSAYIADFISDTLFQYSFPFAAQVSDGFIEVRVNGVTVISESSSKTLSNNDDNYHKFSFSCGSSFSHGVTSDIDDFYIWNNNGFWNNSFLGDRRCYFLKPNQDTNIADFEPSEGNFGYKMIDDESPDDDSTYIIAEAYLQSGSPLTGTSEFEIESLPDGASLITAVNVVTRASKTDSTSAEIFTSINSGADSLSQSAHVLTTSYQYFADIYEYDPSTISNLTKEGLNALSVSVTADDLDPGVTFDSPEDVVSPEDQAFDPSQLFSGGQDGFWFDFSDLSTLWQDTSATTPVTTSGDSIARIDDKIGNGYNATQSTASARPTYTESGSIRWGDYDGNDILTILSSTSTLAWAHKDVGLGVAILVRIGATANPNTVYGLYGNNGTSASKVGISTFYDDRSSVSRNDTTVYTTMKGGGGALYSNIPPNNSVQAITDLNHVINIPPGGPSDCLVDNTSVQTAAKSGTESAANATHDFQIGATGGNFFPIVGRIYQVIIRDEEFTTAELSDIQAYFESKLV